MKKCKLTIGIATAILMETAVATEIPAVFAHAVKYQAGKMVMVDEGKVYPLQVENPLYTLENMEGQIAGTDTGLAFDFGDFAGTMYYGLINFQDGRNPMPVFFKKSVNVQDGKAEINIKNDLAGKYDMSDWEKTGKGTLGYRLVNTTGNIIYDGRISFLSQNTILVNVTFVEEPTVNIITSDSVVITFRTNLPTTAIVRVGNRTFHSNNGQRHEINVTGLSSDTNYNYTVTASSDTLANSQSYSFRTAPKLGTRKAFVFAYASDSRNGTGGGERDIYGTNAYVMKKLMAVAQAKQAAFFQFTGDMIDGRLNNISATKLQYQNWKRAIEPFTHYLPVYTAMGNHEGLFHRFDDSSKIGIEVARFPFATESAEAIFANQFVLPKNGPISEDGAEYDPNPQIPGDFPSYKENVYYYIYDNVAIVVLNSNYLFSRSFKYWFAKKAKQGSLLSGGGLHGYLMDKQLEWLDDTLDKLEADPNIDFVFTTQHTPLLPNGGHKVDDMWYDGDNTPRPHIAGKPVRRGVIEQRDRYLDMLLKHKKVVAVLTGDEHNYVRTKLTPETTIYLPDWDKPKVQVNRSLWLINNGTAGAPYYAQEVLPWSKQVKTFSTQNAVVLFNVHGRNLRMEVINPETLERIE